jgi:DNA-binding CsgD family transcriptional regulator
VGRIADALGFGPTYTSWRSAVALGLPASRRDEALALAREELDRARRSGLPRPEGVSLRTLGLLEAPEAGLEHLRDSVSALEPSPARLELARSLVELGATLHRSGSSAEARDPLRRALQLAQESGADRLAKRARAELQAAGGRPGTAGSARRDRLTASELRVALLAAQGMSTPEIAQDLYVSPKTIESHLHHAYAKLGLSGRGARRRLAQALDAA